MNGADISKHNVVVDFGKTNLDFVLIRAGFGNDISQKDPKFDEYMKAAIAHGKHVGVYWFSYAVSIADALKEAAVCKQVIAPYKGQIDFPIAFDYEYDSIKWAADHKIAVANTADSMARAFMDSMAADSWFVNLYTNIDFIKSGRFSAETIKKYDVWLADYNGAPDYPCYIQQTTSTGSVLGITGNVDLDVSFRDYPTLIMAGGYNGYPKQVKTAIIIDTTTDVKMEFGKAYTFYTESSQAPSVTCGTALVVSLLHCRRDTAMRRDYWHIIAIGKSGQRVGIYTAAPGEQPVKRFVAEVA